MDSRLEAVGPRAHRGVRAGSGAGRWRPDSAVGRALRVTVLRVLFTVSLEEFMNSTSLPQTSTSAAPQETDALAEDVVVAVDVEDEE
ncbi:hypothetical protein GCM10009549_14000 [Streptomyces thermoalcalitolerans]|uniref:Uncharacterized protein n=1 Tax=Streptomyces thermoalcalitolerans TaxID=65605 RepID=A0ABN1NI74_9ACTN